MLVPFDQIKAHEEKWRLIICPGTGSTCTAMIPFCKVLTHVHNCPDCVWPPTKDNVISGLWAMDKARAFDGRSMKWKTSTHLLQGSVFFVRKSRKGDMFMIDVAMKGSKEDCKEFMVEAAILDAVLGKSMFKATFQPR